MPRQLSRGPGALKKRRAAALDGWRTRRRNEKARNKAMAVVERAKAEEAGLHVSRIIHGDDFEEDYDEMD